MVQNSSVSFRGKFSRGDLLLQITGLALLISTIILALFGWQSIQLQSQKLEKNLNHSIETYAEWLANALELPLYNFDSEVVTALGNSMVLQQDVVKIVLTANERKSVFYNIQYADNIPHEKSIFVLKKEVEYTGIRLGEIEVFATNLSLQKQIRWASFSIILQIVLLDLFLVVSIVFFLSRRFIQPVEELQNAAARIASGDLFDPIRVSRRNELGRLAESLDVMRKTLQEKIVALELEVVERNKAEAELSTAKDEIDNIIDSMPSILIKVDGACRITHWNRTAEEKTGVPANKARSMLVQDVFPYIEDVVEKITLAMEKGEPLFENARMLNIDGIKR